MVRDKTRWATLTVLIAASFLAGGGRGLAQEPIPLVYPAHIHQGSCGELDPSPRFSLSDIPVETAPDSATDASTALPGTMSVTTLAVRLEDLLAGTAAIDVHESGKNTETDIACGDIGGAAADGNLVIGLREQNGSGYAGIAHLRAAGEETEVAVFLIRGLAATPTAGDEAQAQATEAQVAFYVPTITCPGCQLRVDASVRKAPGILDVAIDGQQVTVTYDPSAVSPAEIEAAIEAGGDTANDVTTEG